MTLDTPSLGEVLESCPFCGERHMAYGGIAQREVYVPDSFRMHCNCGATGPRARTGPEAIIAWNTRVQLPEAREDEGRLPEPWRLMTREEFRTLNIAGPFRVDLNYDGFGNVAVWLSAVPQPVQKSEVK